MKTNIKFAIALMAAAWGAAPSIAPAQCVPSTQEESAPAVWRQRLAAWVPSLTLQLSDRISRHDDGQSRTASQLDAGVAVTSPSSIQLERRGRRVDWSVGAHWNVLEIIESLSPTAVVDSHEDDSACTDRVGAPNHLSIEEEP